VDKDLELTNKNYKLIKGDYANYSVDTFHYPYTLIDNFQSDSLTTQVDFLARIEPINRSTIRFELFHADTINNSFEIKGKTDILRFSNNDTPTAFVRTSAVN
jgi:hypothetical protein